MSLCPMCGGATHPFLTSRDTNRRVDATEFVYRECAACGLVYLANPPADLGPFYAGGYQRIPANLDELRTLAAPEKYRLEPLLRHKTGGRLVEIGPWIGLFAVNAKEAGFDVAAIERDPRCVAFLNDVAGIEAWQSEDPAATLAAHPEGFDVVAMWHSLEHLPAPWKVVGAAAAALRPGGVLLIAIPNIASRQAETMGAGWSHLDAPRHLTFLPPRTLAALCARHGLEQVHLTTADHLSDLLAEHSWANYVRARLRIGVLRRVFARRIRARLERRYQSWQEEEGRGAGLTAIFRKPA